MRKDLHRLSDAEHQIFERAPDNPNLFTNFYLRGPNSGTFAYADSPDKRLVLLHKALMRRWLKLDKPREFDFVYSFDEVPLVPFEAVTGQVFERGLVIPDVPCTVTTKIENSITMPMFHIHHGLWLQDWQLDIMRLKQDAIVLIGGYGSSKTTIAEVDMEIKAVTLPGFLGFVIAPGGIASTAVYDKWMQRIEGTLYEKRFFLHNVSKPPQKIVVGNDYVGQSTIKYYSVHDDQNKIKNVEGDMMHVDQAEQLDDIYTMKGNSSSRLRGNYQGRRRVGKTYWIANPNDNPDLWNLADESLDNPDFTYYKQVSSYENWALDEKELRRFERDFGKTVQERNSNLFGFRPIGDGKQFSGEVVKNCLSTLLDEQMEKGLLEKKQGYIKQEASRIGIWRWELPYEEGHTYMVMADPGQDNPPNRNAACIGVWDITSFPSAPAQLAAFHWVFGNNSPIPWMQAFFDYVEQYKAVGRCGYDNTGWQSGYLSWVETFAQIQSTGMNMNQNNKFMHLNSAKQLMSRGMIKFPTIQAIISQLAKYNLPDADLIQDVVVMIMLTCTWLQQLFYLDIPTTERNVKPTHHDRHEWRRQDRRAGRFR